MPTRVGKPDEKQLLELPDAVATTLDEARMVLPGVQALFGFQFIAVFNSGFEERLSQPEQIIHLVAIILTLLSTALVMAPAAYHRQSDPNTASRAFIRLSTMFISWAMVPLILSICCDIFLIAKMILSGFASALAIAVGVGITIFFIWFVFPHLVKE